MSGLALDGGSAWVKRARLEGEVPRAVPDRTRGTLRTPRGLLPRGTGPLLAALLGDTRPTALALVAPDPGAVDALLTEARQLLPAARVSVLPSSLAAALELGAEGAQEGTRDAVLDLGHAAVRLELVEWRAWEGRAFPRLVVGASSSIPLGGARLDEDLGHGRDASAPGFAELKELLGAARGPIQRALDGGAVVELPAREAQEALRAWLEGLHTALPTLAQAVREARATRVLATGGLLGLAPARQAVERTFAAGPRLLVAREPSFAACRGAARSLARPLGPTAPVALGVPVRRAGRVAWLPLVPAGAELDQRFGPLELAAVPAGEDARAGAPVPAHLLGEEGQGFVARLPDFGGKRLAVWWRWSWEEGWRCEPAGGAPVRAEPLPPEEAAALRSAWRLDWEARGRALPLDLLLVFRATRGSPAAAALAGAAAERLLAVAAGAAPSPRLRALAVGDHPQGHIAPAFVTRCSGAWSADPAPQLAFVRERLQDPVEGLDPAEAFECALREAGRLDWRPDARRVVVLLGDAPAHLPDEPPFCPVDWRAEAAALKKQSVQLVPVHLQAGGVPPAIRAKTLELLAGLGPVVALKLGAFEEAERAVAAAAAAREPDAEARGLLARVRVE